MPETYTFLMGVNKTEVCSENLRRQPGVPIIASLWLKDYKGIIMLLGIISLSLLYFFVRCPIRLYSILSFWFVSMVEELLGNLYY